MKTTKKLLSLIFSLLLIIQPLVPALSVLADETDENTIYISNAADLSKLARSCKLDTWSVGKTVVLKNDIDVSKSDFSCIPSFGGVFDGDGHTIRGISYTKSGSVVGLFRYVSEGAEIKHLTVEAMVNPGGSKENIGGIAGKNSGTINNCTLRGTVRGKSYVGGIAGFNQAPGRIINCTVEGAVYGEHYVGGIAGDNMGQIIKCTNRAFVNNTAVDIKFDIKNIDLTDLISTENFADITDVGGIVGYSGGIIQGCENLGEVGYIHIGYNIGGIAGRQAGYINGCTNRGKVLGRKDVGGITGQTEPYTTLLYSPDSLENISSELDTLQGLLDRALGDANISRMNISNRLSSVRSNTDDARDAIQKMTDDAQDFYNNTADSINDTTARLSDTVDKIMPQMQSIGDAITDISKITDEYNAALDLIEEGFDVVDSKNLKDAVDSLKKSMDELSEASKLLSRALNMISDNIGDPSYLEDAIGQFTLAAQKFETAIDNINSSLDAVKTAARAIADNIKNGDFNAKADLLKFFGAISDAVDAVKNGTKDIKNSVLILRSGMIQLRNFLSDTDLEDLTNAIKRLSNSMSHMAWGLTYMKDAMHSMSAAFDELDDAADKIRDGAKAARKTTDKISDKLDGVISSSNSIIDALDDFSQQPTLTIDRISDTFVYNKDRLSDSVSSISDAIFDVKDLLDGLGNDMHGDLQSISDQMFRVFDSFTDAADDAKDKSTDPSDYVEDVSDTDNAAQTQGVISASENYGSVSGDLNSGGIVGSMAIEYDFDPEDDISKNGSKSLNFIYTTKAIVRECKNFGDIESKKSYAGGIVGKSDLGSIIGCVGCGTITSDSGEYVGGIAGYSKFSIRTSYSKAALSGDKYVGGIAGFGHNIYASYSIPDITQSEEYTGSIAGDSDGAVTACFFAGSDFGGIDDISYSTKAEELSYEDLIALDGIPAEFLIMKLTFYVDDKLTDTIEVNYCDSLAEDQIPKIPPKENCYGEWDIESFDNITRDHKINAIYTDYITSIEGKAQRKNGLPVFVAEGKFSDKSEITETDKTLESNISKNDHISERWDIAVSDNSADKTIIHYLPQDGAKKVRVRVLKDGKWINLKCGKDGQYVTFEIDGSSASISISPKASNTVIAVTASVSAAAVLAAAFVVMKKLNVFSKKK